MLTSPNRYDILLPDNRTAVILYQDKAVKGLEHFNRSSIVNPKTALFFENKMIRKLCGRCKILKPISEFYKDKSKKSGVGWECKECFSFRIGKLEGNEKGLNYYELKIKVNNRCKICNKLIKPRKDTKYCRTCWQKGEKGNNWQGGISTLSNMIYCSPQYAEWRNKIYKRDNYICQKCGRGRSLQAHHKIALTELRDSAVEKLPLLEEFEACLLYKPLWDIKNGITMCGSCHRKKHWRIKNATKHR